LRGLPGTLRRCLLWVGHLPIVSHGGAFLTLPFVAWAVHAVALWIWHLPALFATTVSNDLMHALQHLTFLASALLFWWAILDGRRKVPGYGVAVLYVFGTALHSGILGAMLTFAHHPWYAPYFETTRLWGVSPLEDQQLGGLIMWIPASVIYVAAGLALFARWLKESGLRLTGSTFQLEQPTT
jgi:putative membrane protein